MSPWVAWRYHLTRKRWLAPAAALFGIVAVVVGFNVGGVRDRLVGSPPAAPPIKLAVLPFENLTGDPEQEYFSDGLTEEMITQLGRLHPQRLSVIARTSSMRYKNRDVPVDQIGRELGVDFAVQPGHHPRMCNPDQLWVIRSVLRPHFVRLFAMPSIC